MEFNNFEVVKLTNGKYTARFGCSEFFNSGIGYLVKSPRNEVAYCRDYVPQGEELFFDTVEQVEFAIKTFKLKEENKIKVLEVIKKVP